MMFRRWLISVAAGPWQSGSWAALLAMLAVIGTAAPVMLLSPMLFVASGGVIVLTALRQDFDGLWRALFFGALVLLAAGYAVGLGAGLLAVVVAVFWAPLVLTAQRLRRAGFGGAIQVVMLLTIVVLIAGRQSDFQPASFLVNYTEVIKQQVASGVDAETNIHRLEQIFGWLETYFWGWISASFGLLWMVALMLGRYWHALLDNPGGFVREFESLRLGVAPVLLALVAAVVGGLGQSTIAWELVALVLIGISWQGMACVQSVFTVRKVNRVARVGFYCLLAVFALQVGLVLSLIGVLDNVFDFRSRLVSDGGQ